MGQKVNPIGLRLGINKEWVSTWYANKKQYPQLLKEDIKLRAFVKDALKAQSVAEVIVERLSAPTTARPATLTVLTSRPGGIIGLQGKGTDQLRQKILACPGLVVNGLNNNINIQEIRKPEICAALVAQNIAMDLQRRVAFRRSMKKVMASAMKAGIQGIKVTVSGRLGGAEIARVQSYREGRVPLHTLRADIDYSAAEALTTYGIIGIKVWIFKGEVMREAQPVPEKSK